MLFILSHRVYDCGIQEVSNRVSNVVTKRVYLLQLLNGLPVNPFGQKQIGFPLSFSQSAFVPHGLGAQGLEGGSHPTCGLPV